MTLFTAEGILRAETCCRSKGICHPPSVKLFEVMTLIADDLLVGYNDSRDWQEKYPGY